MYMYNNYKVDTPYNNTLLFPDKYVQVHTPCVPNFLVCTGYNNYI